MLSEQLNRHINQILVHSYLYSVEHAVWSDYQWDMAAKNLAKELKEHKDIAVTLPYHEQFIDWEGDTAMNFRYDDNIVRRAQLAYWAKTGTKLEGG